MELNEMNELTNVTTEVAEVANQTASHINGWEVAGKVLTGGVIIVGAVKLGKLVYNKLIKPKRDQAKAVRQAKCGGASEPELPEVNTEEYNFDVE